MAAILARLSSSSIVYSFLLDACVTFFMAICVPSALFIANAVLISPSIGFPVTALMLFVSLS